jgi:hypothetical protein
MRYRREKEAKRDAKAQALAWTLMTSLSLKDFRAVEEFADAILCHAMQDVMSGRGGRVTNRRGGR